MEAIILAGGFGTRLRHVVSDVPKPMALVDGRPFLRYILDDLIQKGISRIVIAVGYRKEIIINFLGDSYRGVDIVYSVEEMPLLTGGAIKKALKKCESDTVFIVNGDTYFDVELSEMQLFKRKSGAKCVIASTYMYEFDRYGTLNLDKNNIILGFEEKKKLDKGVINGGIYLIDRNYLDDIEKDIFSLEKEVFEYKVGKHEFAAFISNGYFIDIGVPNDYIKAQDDFKNKHPSMKAVFFDRDGTLNIDTHYLYKKEDMVLVNGMPEFIKKWNDWGYKVIVVTNQSGIARGFYSVQEMKALHQYMNEKLNEFGAHIDAFYFCPHHPDFTGECICRKPASGMIETAIREFDLRPEDCLLFGDNDTDIIAAENIGVKGILISNVLS